MIFHSLHNVSIIICVLFSFYCFKFLTFSGFKVIEIHKYCSTVCPTIVFHYSFEDYIVCSLFHYSFEDYSVPLVALVLKTYLILFLTKIADSQWLQAVFL